MFDPFKYVFDIIVLILRNLRVILLTIGVSWILYTSYKIVTYGISKYQPIANLVSILDANQFLVQILGPLFLIATCFSVYWSRRKYFHSAVRILRTYPQIDDVRALPELISEREVQDRLISFSGDAASIRILAGGGDFLVTDTRQYNEIQERNGSCQMLISDGYDVPVDVLKLLIDNGLKARIYPADHDMIDMSLRGRLKQAAGGRSACVFDKQQIGYRVVELTNSTLVDMLFQKFDDWFTRGKNPLIKHVIFDLAGVFFDGDIENFYKTVSQVTNKSISPTSEDYLRVNEDLNLGKIDILGFVKQKLGVELSVDNALQITNAWSITWVINRKMDLLAQSLKQHGYTISVCSNCDKENADRYEVKNYFDVFDHLFLSCNMNLLKPTNEFFEHILQVLNAKPYECLFIDDHRKNIQAAKNLGFETILVTRAITPEERDEFIKRRLDNLAVHYS
jgi:putative hydrolase of the HAD superfamily